MSEGIQPRRKKARDYVGTWDGGFIRRANDGRQVYIIRRMVQGRVYKVSTRTHSNAAALEQLKRFEADPAGYVAAGSAPASTEGPLYLGVELATDYLRWCRDVGPKRRGHGNSARWLNKQKGYLAWWGEQLRGVDLRKAGLREHLEPALGDEIAPGQPGYSTRAKRIAIIKGLYSYLRTAQDARKRGYDIRVDQDPVFGALKVPQSDPNARKMKDKAVPKADVVKVIRILGSKAFRDAQGPRAGTHWKDALELQAGTGWHVTEVERFAAGVPVMSDGEETARIRGRVEAPRKNAADPTWVLVCPEVKGGGELRTSVSPKVSSAANRLLEHGSFSIEKYGLALKAACKFGGVTPFTPGRMRHSVATHAHNNGADLASIADFLNHKSAATTKNFYAKFGVAKKPPTML